MNTDHSEDTSETNDLRASLASLPTLEDDDATRVLTTGPSDVTIVTAVPIAEPSATPEPDGLDVDVTSVGMESLDSDPFGQTVAADPLVADGHQPSVATTDQGFSSYGTGLAEEAHKSGRGAGVLKRILIVVGVLVAAALIAYVAVGFYFTSHFMPNTTVNGEDVSGMSVEALADHVTQIGDGYAMHVTGDGIDATIAASDIDYSLHGDEYAAEAKAQTDPWHWLEHIRETHELTVTQSITFDQAKLDAQLDAIVKAANEGASQPTNATMKYDDTTKRFEIVDQAYGTTVERDAVVTAVTEGVQTLKESVEITEAELVQPTVWNDDEKLTSTVEKANGLLTSPIPLRVASTGVATVDPSRVAEWVTMDANTELVVDREAVKKWAQGELSDLLDTVGNKHTYTRPDGKQIEVQGGTYGWIIDGEALSNLIADNLQAGSNAVIDIPVKQSAANWSPSGQEWSNRYIDVDLSEQYVRMYDENSNIIWETACVSGNPKYGGGTSTGVSFIYEKDSPMILVGNDYDHDGQPDYKTPVDFWMPFEGGQGLHDASWRYYFGGEIYAYDGSHGCVNLPYDKARELYDITNVGDVVVVHW